MPSAGRDSDESTSSTPNRRQALLDATVKVVAHGGLRNLTYRAVAAEAGVAHGLVRHYFGSRDALIVAALESALATAVDLYDDLQPGEAVDTFLSGLVELVSDNPDLQAFQYELMLEARRSGALAEQVRQLYTTYISATRDALTTVGITADDTLALLIYAALDGLVLHQLVMNEPVETEKALGRLRQMLARER